MLLGSRAVIPEAGITVLTVQGAAAASAPLTSHTWLCQLCGGGLADVYGIRQLKLLLFLIIYC